MRCVRALTPLACAALGLAWTVRALASSDCAALVVEADGSLRGLDAELPERVRRALEGRDGVDTCARVMLGRRAAALRVDVWLDDGRRTTRSVRDREDVIPTLEALLYVPELPPAGDDARATELAGDIVPEPAPVDSPATNGASPPDEVDRANPSQRPEQRQPAVSDAGTSIPSPGDARDRLGIELSVVTSARVGDGQSSIGLGVLSLVELWGWLAGIEGRADGYDFTGDGPHATLELAALGGRRFRFESLALDVVGGPALALTGESTTESGPVGTRTHTSPGAVPRLLVHSHLSFSPRAPLRTFIGVDAEVGARGPSDGDAPGATRGLPLWVLGIALGATLGSR